MTDAYLDRVCPLPPPPGAVPRVLTRQQALALGVSARSVQRYVRSGRWRRLLPRIYATVDPLTEGDRWGAALLFAGDGAALSGAAALRASDVRGITPPDRILVLVPPPNRTGSSGWVQVRRSFRRMELVHWYGPSRVEAARAAADLALCLTRLDDVRAVIAKVVQQRHCTVADLGAELAAGPRNGSAFLRQALEEVGWGAESAPEARALRLLHLAGITGFQPNASIQLIDGSWRRVDAYWPRLRASLEMDGKQWHFDGQNWTESLDRDLDLAKVGVYGIHRPPSALRDAAGFVADIRAWLTAREADLRMGLLDHVADARAPRWSGVS